MRNICTLLILMFLNFTAFSQTEKDSVRQPIEIFFDGFHARDSIVMKSVFHKDPVIQTVGKTKDGTTKLFTEELEKVLKGIVSIPLETEFKEVIHDYVIKLDGDMANVWTPYSFYVNEAFSHCGVNNFQLLKQNGEWKIIYLIDTRRREGCEEKKLK